MHIHNHTYSYTRHRIKTHVHTKSPLLCTQGVTGICTYTLSLWTPGFTCDYAHIHTSTQYMHRHTYVYIHPSTYIDTLSYPSHTSTHLYAAMRKYTHLYTLPYVWRLISVCVSIFIHSMSIQHVLPSDTAALSTPRLRLHLGRRLRAPEA